MIHVLFSFGTRPEAIKLAPVITYMLGKPKDFRVTVCLTSQHKEMLRQVTDFFGIHEDADLDIMVPNQTLEHITSSVLLNMRDVLEEFRPDVLLVQGDTTTVFSSALAAFYAKIPVGHVEAGLRTFNKYSPFPEEINRGMTSVIAEYHFAPTRTAADNLRREGCAEKRIHVTGNTVVDALLLGKSLLDRWDTSRRKELLRETGLPEDVTNRLLDRSSRFITVTAHRRESFGAPFEQMLYAMKDIVETHSDVEIVYPVHRNPNVREPVDRLLRGNSRIHLLEPLRYEQLLFLMDHSVLLLTDSGGIQEEGPSLRKPVLVMREVTERPEGIEAGVSRLVGTDRSRIVNAVNELLTDSDEYSAMITGVNPYGDGRASERIAEVLLAGGYG